MLSPSETFIANQARALSSWVPSYAALDYEENDFGIHPLVATSPEDPRLANLLSKSDLVHAHFAPDAMSIRPIAARIGTPLVCTFHGFDVTVRHLYWDPRERRKLRSVFSSSRVLIAVSEHVARRLQRLGAPPEKVVVHHIGVPLLPDHDTSVTERHGILFVGRLVPKKGCRHFLAAVAQSPRLRSEPITIIGDGPERQALEKAAQRLPNVRFLRSQSNATVRQLMKESALLCAPSCRALNGDTEGLPITILEASASRLPVVSTFSSGIPEAVVHNETGILVHEKSPPELAIALETLLDDLAMRKRFGEAGRRHVEVNFEIGRQTRLLEEIYARAAG